MDSFLQIEDSKEREVLKIDQVQEQKALTKVNDHLQIPLCLLVKFKNLTNN